MVIRRGDKYKSDPLVVARTKDPVVEKGSDSVLKNAGAGAIAPVSAENGINGDSKEAIAGKAVIDTKPTNYNTLGVKKVQAISIKGVAEDKGSSEEIKYMNEIDKIIRDDGGTVAPTAKSRDKLNNQNIY
ncbi:hypothetical protein AYI70_g5111 [Smittium culicis]|uniref:Uncharacterized protein n=1 Tax=Smittium culicis TaxID=133412 RepID=A0A1R1XW72_9FUNG|nr:hypothetical protein AYI70_g5111 [Smittium culicis]